VPDLAARYAAVRQATVRLAAPLATEDLVAQSMPEASPTKWHLAHTTWFFEVFLLLPRLPGYRVFHEAFEALFNSYYEAVGTPFPRPRRGLCTRPTVAEVMRYRAHVDEAMGALLAQRAGDEALAALVTLGLAHEEQHQELILTDLKHLFYQNPLRPAYRERPAVIPGETPPLTWLEHPGGVVEIGHGGEGFFYDNESPRHRVFLRPFAIATRPVTCGELRAFVEDGAYENPALWLSDGFAMVRAAGLVAPLYWEKRDGAWATYTLAGMRPLDDAEPVCHVSHYEADAFARWSSARLPTEAEWEVAARSFPPAGTFLEDHRFHPAPRGAGEGPHFFGDVWEWTASAYLPYPGYRPPAGALGEYNGKFMSGQMVLRGGSAFTPRGHVRPTYRNFFPPGARWQLSGLRLARDVEG
jgi:ergothioneine biosynthesis protein EgtB